MCVVTPRALAHNESLRGIRYSPVYRTVPVSSCIMPTTFVDDKAPICVPFILEHLASHRARHAKADGGQHSAPPLAVGLNGIQGAGKTTLVAALTLALKDEGVHAVVCSIDDFYLTHGDQTALATQHPDNALVQHRGEPGTGQTGHATRKLPHNSSLVPYNTTRGSC